MKTARTAALLAALAMPATAARAEIGWTLEQYTQTYGPGERSYGTVPEVGFRVGDCRLVAEFSGDRSVAEVWLLGVEREKIPRAVLDTGAAAAAGPLVEHVDFAAQGAVDADIHQAVVGGVLVRAEVRNHLLHRVALCARAPACGWWAWLVGRCPEPRAGCPILARITKLDRRLDEFHVLAERAVNESIERRRGAVPRPAE